MKPKSSNKSLTELSQKPELASPYLRMPEAVKYLNVSKRTMARFIAGHKIPCVRATRRLLLFKRSDLDAAMQRLTVNAI